MLLAKYLHERLFIISLSKIVIQTKMKKILILLLLTIPLASFGQNQFKRGYYIDNDSNKLAGLIKFNRASLSVFGSTPTSIRIKRDNENKKIKIKDMKGFVIEKDSFALISNFKMNSIGGEFKNDFAKVIEIGKINLYMHYCSSYDGQSFHSFDTYVLSKSGSGEYFAVYDSVEHKKYLLNLIKENAELTERLNNMSKKEWIGEIQNIIKEYNSNIL